MSEETTTAETTGTAPETITTTPVQTPIEQEIARETNRTEGRTEAEKAAFSLKKNLERAKELGVDVNEVLGIQAPVTAPTTLEKDTPLTVGMYEEMQKAQGQKTALELAQNIPDQNERDLVITYLKTRIVPSGDAQEDVRFARLAVNSIKNGQIAEELGRKTTPATHVSSSGAPLTTTETEPELTALEQQFTKQPFNMSVADIVKLRPKE